MKVKRFQQEANWGSARLAAAYSRWMDQEVLALPPPPSCKTMLGHTSWLLDLLTYSVYPRSDGASSWLGMSHWSTAPSHCARAVGVDPG